MPKLHTVKQGESLASIAAHYGLTDWKKIYYDPANGEFRQKRPNPHVIYPGDEVTVPDRETRDEQGGTDARHSFETKASRVVLRVKLQNGDDEALSGYAYDLVVGGQTFGGTTDADGRLEHGIPASAREGQLTLHLGAEEGNACVRWHLRIAHLDPVEYLTGVQARLNNLGFDSGPVDGLIGPITRGAVRAFQDKHDLDVDGIPGPITQGKLKEVYGC